jgi:hypothetical protein
MCHNKSTIVVLILFGLFIGTSVVSLAQPAKSTGKACPPGVLTTTLDAPPDGMANFRTIRLDDNCRPILGPVRTVPLELLPDIALDVETRKEAFESTDEQERSAAARIKRVFRAEQAVLDVVNITLNKLYGRINFKYDGSKILKFKASGGSFAHQENYPLSCATGWYLGHHFNAQVGGGVGTSSASFAQYAEFGYRGFFDCSGRDYYNKLSNHITVYGNGSATCQFTQHYRTWSVLWYWTMACY